MGRVFKAHVQAMVYFAGKDRAGFVCIVANSYHIVPFVLNIFIDHFRIMRTNIDTCLGHHHNGFLIYLSGRYGTGRMNLDVLVERL